jgi:hypothetical protein
VCGGDGEEKEGGMMKKRRRQKLIKKYGLAWWICDEITRQEEAERLGKVLKLPKSAKKIQGQYTVYSSRMAQ